MIRTDLGIATAYAEAVSKGYTGTRDEFGQMLADFGKTAEKVTEDKKAVEQMKLFVEETMNSVDTTVAEFGQNVADKTAEAKAAITEHANTEKELATAAISEAKDAATGAITEAQTSATDAIASAKDSATAEIAKKGTDTLATIPEDYTALTKNVSSLKEDLSTKITKFYASNQDETHITDSDNGKIQDMMIYGKSSQDETPSPDNPVEIKSVVNPTIKVCGKNLLQPNLRYRDRVKINIKKDVKLTLICKNGVVSKGGNLKFEKANGELLWFGFDKGSVKQQIMLYNDVVAYTYLFPSEPSESYALYIGDENTYEPYKEQSMQLHITLNAIPVSSGGNVTINGQQYIADYVDVERGKIVKCVEKYRIPSDLKWLYEPSENNRFGAYQLNININPIFGKKTLFTHYQNALNGVGGFIEPGNIRLHNFQGFTDVTSFKEWLDKNESYAYFAKNTLEETDLTTEQIQALKELATYYPTTNISVNSEQLDGYTVFNYPISMANGWNYVKQQLNDNRDYIYDMDLHSAEAYVNSEYAVALTELEV